MASIWSKTKLRRAERVEGLGFEEGSWDWEVEKDLWCWEEEKKKKEGLGFREKRERRLVLVSRRKNGP